MSDLIALITGAGLPPTPKTGQGRLVLRLTGTNDAEDPDDPTWPCATCGKENNTDGYYWYPKTTGGHRRGRRCKKCHIAQSENAARRKREKESQK